MYRVRRHDNTTSPQTTLQVKMMAPFIKNLGPDFVLHRLTACNSRSIFNVVGGEREGCGDETLDCLAQLGNCH